MGDRVSVWFTTKKEHLPDIARAFESDEEYSIDEAWKLLDRWGEPLGPGDVVVEVHLDEVNGGGIDELTALAEKGVVLVGSHSHGCAYGPHDFYCHEGKYHDWESGHDGGLVINNLEVEGMIGEEVGRAREFLRGYALVNRILDEAQPRDRQSDAPSTEGAVAHLLPGSDGDPAGNSGGGPSGGDHQVHSSE